MNINIILFVSLGVLIVLIIFSLFILSYIDKKTDYSKKEFRPYFISVNGSYEVRIPYYFWQINKLKEIEKRYSKEIIYENKIYTVEAIFKHQVHESNNNISLYFCNDFVATVRPKQENHSINHYNETNIYNDIHDNKNVHIEQNQTYNNISSKIDLLLQLNLDDVDKQCLELFKIKLSQKNIKVSDKNRVLTVLDKLSKYAPYASLVSSIITLIKSLI